MTESSPITGEEYRAIFEGNLVPMWVVDIETFRFLAVNDAAIHAYGYSRAEFLSMDARLIRPPEDIPLLESAVKKLNQGADSGPEMMGVFRHRKKDGTVFPVEITRTWLQFRDGKTWLTMARDVSERLAVQEALKVSEERLRQMTEAIEEVFWMTNTEKNEMVYISPGYEKIWGRTCESLYQEPKSWVLSIHPEDRDRVLSAAVSKQAIGQYDEVYRIVRPDGGIRWIRDRAFPVKNDAGKVYRVVGIAEDVTKQKELEEALIQTEKLAAIGQLAAGVAHEINNPLGVILGFAQSLLKKAPREFSMPLESIVREANRCKGIVRELTIYSRFEKREAEMADLNKLVCGAMALIESNAKMNLVELVLDLAAGLPLIRCHVNRVEQVIVNLCANALDAMPNGGMLTLRTRRIPAEGVKAESLELQVEDNGTGIPKAVQPKIFEPFFTTKEPGKGTGLGLSLVYEIIAQHKGAITFKSEENRGTAFTVRFPVQA